MSNTEPRDSESSLWPDARVAAMETILGPSDDVVGHSTIPFDLGADIGGGADIVFFRNHLDGVGYATSELIGRDEQIPSKIGNYELLVFHRDDNRWGANVISKLSFYTCKAVLNPGATMEIGSATPEESTIAAFLFCDYGRFEVLGRDAGLLLCIGITADELSACRSGNSVGVIAALKEAEIFPFTDLGRQSVF